MVFNEKQSLAGKLFALLFFCILFTGLLSVAIAEFWWLLVSIALSYIFVRGVNKTYAHGSGVATAFSASIFMVMLVVVVFTYVIPPLINASHVTLKQLGVALDSSDTIKQSLIAYMPEEYRLQLTTMLQDLHLSDLASNVLGGAFSYLGVIAHNAALLFAIPLMVFYFMYDNKVYTRMGRMLASAGQSDIWGTSLVLFYEKMCMYLKGKMLEGFIVALVSGLFFYFVVDTQYVVLLTIVTFFSVFVPFAGAALAVLLVGVLFLVEFGIVPLTFVFIGCYIFIHILDGNVLVPIIFNEVLAIPPSATLLSVLLGSWLFGIVGVFLAIPILSVYMELSKVCIAECAQKKA